MILTKRFTMGISFILLISFFFQSLGSMKYHSVSVDEVGYVSYGMGFLKTRNFDILPYHPPLVMLISGVPISLLGPKFPQESWSAINAERYATDFLYVSNTNTDHLVYWARYPIVLLGIILGVLIYQWSSQLYGPKGGLFSLFIFCFNPLMISYFNLALTDVPMTFFVFSSIFTFYKYLNDPKMKNLFITGFHLGLALLSKVLSLFLVPMIIIIFLFSSYGKKFSDREKGQVLATIFGVGFLVMWAGYGFEMDTISSKIFNPDRVLEPIEKLPGTPFLKSGAKFFMEKLPIPFPNYFKGIYLNTIDTATKRVYPTYLLGEVREGGGFKSYYVVGFLLKTPLPLIIAVFIAFWSLWKTQNKDEILFLLMPITAYFVIASINPLKDGMRYMIYIYPFFAVLAGKLANFDNSKSRSVIILVLSLWYLVGTISVYPHYEAYYNEIAGGPDNGYKYFVGRSDAGQQLKLLNEYIKSENIDEIKIAKYGFWIPYELEYRGIKYKNLTCDKTAGIIVLGARELQGESRYGKDCFSWLKYYEPVERIGYTLFVYNVST